MTLVQLGFVLTLTLIVTFCNIHDLFYTQIKAEEHGMEPGDLVKLSQAELSMRLGTDAGGGSWRGKKGRGKVSCVTLT